MPGGFRLHISDTLEKDVERMQLAELRDAARVVAVKIADDARSSAPVVSGKYRDSFEVRNTRAGAEVINSDPVAHILEFGAPGRNLPARWLLRQAGARSGLDWKKHR